MNYQNHREVPLSVQFRLLFGGFFNQFGWAFFGFGMIFVLIFGLQSDVSSIYFTGKLEQQDAFLIHVEPTTVSSNNAPVNAFYFRYRAPNGEPFQSISYSTDILKDSAMVKIEYPSGKPHLARIVGMRRAQFPPIVLVVLIFPAVGLGMMYIGMRKGLKSIQLLKNGILTRGRLLAKKPTHIRVNNQPMYEYQFEFKDELGQMHLLKEKAVDNPELEDEALETLLYDPDKPQKGILLDNLPGAPVLDENGTIEPAPLLAVSLVMLIPLIDIIVYGSLLLSRLKGVFE
ncbi:hypothetical protein JW964_00100 [candidate division KSB1 bacterium]|nr:hypothetical protein [candidate division KSB1 bacterium]